MSLAVLDRPYKIYYFLKTFSPWVKIICKSTCNLVNLSDIVTLISSIYLFRIEIHYTVDRLGMSNVCLYIFLLFWEVNKNSFFLLLFPVLMHQTVTDPEIRIRIRWLEKVALTSPPPILLKPELQQPQPEIQIPWPKKDDFGSNESEQAALMKEEEEEEA